MDSGTFTESNVYSDDQDPNKTLVEVDVDSLKIIGDGICKLSRRSRPDLDDGDIFEIVNRFGQHLAEGFIWVSGLTHDERTHTNEKMGRLKIWIEDSKCDQIAKDFFVNDAPMSQLKKIAKGVTMLTPNDGKEYKNLRDRNE